MSSQNSNNPYVTIHFVGETVDFSVVNIKNWWDLPNVRSQRFYDALHIFCDSMSFVGIDKTLVHALRDKMMSSKASYQMPQIGVAHFSGEGFRIHPNDVDFSEADNGFNECGCTFEIEHDYANICKWIRELSCFTKEQQEDLIRQMWLIMSNLCLLDNPKSESSVPFDCDFSVHLAQSNGATFGDFIRHRTKKKSKKPTNSKS